MIVPTIDCLFEDYVCIFAHVGGDHQGIRPDQKKEKLLRTYGTRFLGRRIMREITNEEIEVMKRILQREAVPVSVIEQLHTALNQLFELALLHGIIRKNPCEGVFRYGKVPKDHVWYTQEQNGKLLKAMERLPNAGVFQTMMMSGILLGECCALTHDRIEIDHHRMIIGQWMAYDTKGAPRLVYGNRHCEEYEIMIPDLLEEVLNRERRRQEFFLESRYGEWHNPDGFVFTDGWGNALRPETIRRQYDMLRRLSGIPGVCMRTLRSSYLINLLLHCDHLPEAAREAGFARVETMIPYYLEACRIKNRMEAA